MCLCSCACLEQSDEGVRDRVDHDAGESADAVEFIGLEWAITQIRGLLANNAPGYHLYTLNRAKSALSLVAALAA